MKKFFLSFLAFLLAAAFAFYFLLNAFLESGIEAFGSRALGTRVTIEDAGFTLLAGSGTIAGIRIANPEGFSSKEALAMHKVTVAVDLGSLFSDTFVIRKFILEAPEVTYETGSKGSNLDAMLRYMKARASQNGSSDASGQTDTGQKLIVDYFQVRNGAVKLHITGLKDKSAVVRLPEVILKDVGRKSGGEQAELVVAQLFNALRNASVKAVTRGGGMSGQEIRSNAKSIEENIKGLFQQ